MLPSIPVHLAQLLLPSREDLLRASYAQHPPTVLLIKPTVAYPSSTL